VCYGAELTPWYTRHTRAISVNLVTLSRAQRSQLTTWRARVTGLLDGRAADRDLPRLHVTDYRRAPSRHKCASRFVIK